MESCFLPLSISPANGRGTTFVTATWATTAPLFLTLTIFLHPHFLHQHPGRFSAEGKRKKKNGENGKRKLPSLSLRAFGKGFRARISAFFFAPFSNVFSSCLSFLDPIPFPLPLRSLPGPVWFAQQTSEGGARKEISSSLFSSHPNPGSSTLDLPGRKSESLLTIANTLKHLIPSAENILQEISKHHILATQEIMRLDKQAEGNLAKERKTERKLLVNWSPASLEEAFLCLCVSFGDTYPLQSPFARSSCPL